MSSLTANATSRFITVQDKQKSLRVHYNDCGSGQETVMMLHGSGPGATGWINFNRNVGPFVDAGFRVLLIDFPGWGESDPVVMTDPRSFFNARVAKGVLDGLGITKVHLVGNSMGGHSAVAFALEFPQHVGRLVLTGGSTGGISLFTAMPTEGMKQVTRLYREPTLENLKAFNDVVVYDSGTLTEDILQLRLKNLRSKAIHLENFVKSVELKPIQFPDITPRLSEIQMPTLIIWGHQDRVTTVDGAFRLEAGIASSEVHLFNRCGHWAQWEHADRFNSIVVGFLRS